MQNFNYPYFSRDIAEFWRRWHISLTTWFRDYCYKPLGGNKRGMVITVRNTFIIFIVSGFWHGANWTFIFWGLINALYFLPLLLLGLNRRNTNTVAEGRVLPSIGEFASMSVTFLLATIAWVFFRASDVPTAFGILKGMFNPSVLSMPAIRDWVLALLIVVFVIIEWRGRTFEHALDVASRPATERRVFYAFVFLLLFFFGVYNENQFIYFQF
jgi:D-alanyl-lipoteichoic acid acyltransferase DltB (MBOAT superfamily)